MRAYRLLRRPRTPPVRRGRPIDSDPSPSTSRPKPSAGTEFRCPSLRARPRFCDTFWRLPGERVSKDALLDAAWNGVAVSEQSLNEAVDTGTVHELQVFSRQGRPYHLVFRREVRRLPSPHLRVERALRASGRRRRAEAPLSVRAGGSPEALLAPGGLRNLLHGDADREPLLEAAGRSREAR